MGTVEQQEHRPSIQMREKDSDVVIVFPGKRPRQYMPVFGVLGVVGLILLVAMCTGILLPATSTPVWVRLGLVLGSLVALLAILSMGFTLTTLVANALEIRLDEQALMVKQYNQELRIPRSDITSLQIGHSRRRALRIHADEPFRHAFSYGPIHSYLISTAHGTIRVLEDQELHDLEPMHQVLLGRIGVTGTTVQPPVASWNTLTGWFRWALLLALIAISALTGLFLARHYVAEQRVGQWASVQGTVVSSKLRKSGRNHIAEMRYRYEVMGQRYESNQVSLTRGDGDYQVRALAESHKEGSTVTVYYDPANPGEATLLRGMDPLEWMLAPACPGALLLAAGLALHWPPAGAAKLLARYPTIDTRRRHG